LLNLEADIEVVGEAADGIEAVTQADAKRPDVIVMDLRLPNLAGPAAIRRVLTHTRESDNDWAPHILVLTTYEDDDSITEAIEAVRATREGHSVLAPSVATAMVRRMRAGAADANLSRREREVLALVVNGLSNYDIAKSLCVESSTVKTHLEHVFTKLGVTSRTQAVTRAQEWGLLPLTPPRPSAPRREPK
jgi:DNA-binding NarL/FixJ family response regulator